MTVLPTLLICSSYIGLSDEGGTVYLAAAMKQFMQPNADEVAEVLVASIPEVDVEPRFVKIPESDRPVIQWPFRGHLIHAPTAAIVYQFREVVCRGRPTRVADGPVCGRR